MTEIVINNKDKFLKDNYPFGNVPQLSDKKHCIHCDTIITVGEYKVFTDDSGFEYICCPNAPECDGTVIDWMPVE